MSLHRVNSISSYEHIRGSSPARSGHGELSFNPLSERISLAAKEEPPDTWQVSEARRICESILTKGKFSDGDLLTPIFVVQIIFASIYCLFAAGIIFGYAALKIVLIKEGAYGEHCSSPEIKGRKRTCYEQQIR